MGDISHTTASIISFNIRESVSGCFEKENISCPYRARNPDGPALTESTLKQERNAVSWRRCQQRRRLQWGLGCRRNCWSYHCCSCQPSRPDGSLCKSQCSKCCYSAARADLGWRWPPGSTEPIRWWRCSRRTRRTQPEPRRNQRLREKKPQLYFECLWEAKTAQILPPNTNRGHKTAHLQHDGIAFFRNLRKL